jgi:predicted RNA polymerase sigma factor
MPLPADGAVSGYAFVIAGRTIVGRVQRRQEARERFERAVEAALDPDGLSTTARAVLDRITGRG